MDENLLTSYGKVSIVTNGTFTRRSLQESGRLTRRRSNALRCLVQVETANGSYLWRHPGRPEAEGARHMGKPCVNLSGERTENAYRRSVCCFVMRVPYIVQGLFLLHIF